MAVKGLDTFIKYFAEQRDSFVLIGGAACHLWFADQNLPFRRTKDLDVVLILEKTNSAFVSRFWEFIRYGGYKEKVRNEDTPPALYRFAKPTQDDFPVLVELFCRDIPQLEVAPDQHIIPVRLQDTQSLSAILLQESYYRFLLDHCRESRGILAADGAALIPLKARAWLDLTVRQERGEEVKSTDIKKHRNDVFGLAVTLPAAPGVRLPDELASDVRAFLDRHPADHSDWKAIQQSMRPIVGGVIPPNNVISAIRTFYQLIDPA